MIASLSPAMRRHLAELAEIADRNRGDAYWHPATSGEWRCAEALARRGQRGVQPFELTRAGYAAAREGDVGVVGKTALPGHGLVGEGAPHDVRGKRIDSGRFAETSGPGYGSARAARCPSTSSRRLPRGAAGTTSTRLRFGRAGRRMGWSDVSLIRRMLRTSPRLAVGQEVRIFAADRRYAWQPDGGWAGIVTCIRRGRATIAYPEHPTGCVFDLKTRSDDAGLRTFEKETA